MIGDEVSQRLGQNTEPCSRSSFQSLCRRLPDSEQCGTVRWRFSDGAIRTMEAQFWPEEHEIRAAPRIPEPRRTCAVGYQCNPVPMAKELFQPWHETIPSAKRRIHPDETLPVLFKTSFIDEVQGRNEGLDALRRCHVEIEHRPECVENMF